MKLRTNSKSRCVFGHQFDLQGGGSIGNSIKGEPDDSKMFLTKCRMQKGSSGVVKTVLNSPETSTISLKTLLSGVMFCV